MIAALFVEPAPRGVYQGLSNVDPWDVSRDARSYAGPWAVVAHPPCERWGRYWHGGPNSVRFPRARRIKGDDAGCFLSALTSIRKWGGVLEHPCDSSAWDAHGINLPPSDGGWVAADFHGGWTCRVEQGHFGHRARKATWLYACGVSSLPSLPWGKSAATVRLDEGFHSAEERRRSVRQGAIPRMGRRERMATPLPFRDLLIGIAEGCR